jgi:1-deoxy-D-xylulose-5-phosphate reductoisomerase
MRTITVLGSTGSIGTNTLDVVRKNRHLYRVYALAAGQNIRLLADQIVEFQPQVVVLPEPGGIDRLRAELADRNLQSTDWPEMACGERALVDISVCAEIDTIISAIVGVAGLEATYEAARAGKRIGLANKEVLVASGKLVMEAVRASGAELVPVDSEHNGAHQCLRAGRAEVQRLILTASGGPFRTTPAADLATVTPAQAL